MTRVLIVGGGFAGLNAAKVLGGSSRVDVTLVDKHNHHLFQPLLYQVAMAGLSPADIAAPIRSMLSSYPNIRVLLGTVTSIDVHHKVARTDIGDLPFDYLILACGGAHAYFGHDEWEEFAPGLKTLEQATEIRRRVLTAFEDAERISDPEERTRLLTFVIVGGGPTGVELAGAIAEMSRFTLARDFRSINASSARVILVEAGPRILPNVFGAAGGARRQRSGIARGSCPSPQRGDKHRRGWGSAWRPARSCRRGALGRGRQSLWRRRGLRCGGGSAGEGNCGADLSIKGHPQVFVAGDQARFTHQTGKPLPVPRPSQCRQDAMPRRRFSAPRSEAAEAISFCRQRPDGHHRAQPSHPGDRFAQAGGWPAWVLWLVIHIYYLTGFKNRLLVVVQWAWSVR